MVAGNAQAKREESPGFWEIWRRVTPGGREPTDSATESKPLFNTVLQNRSKLACAGKAKPEK